MDEVNRHAAAGLVEADEYLVPKETTAGLVSAEAFG